MQDVQEQQKVSGAVLGLFLQLLPWIVILAGLCMAAIELRVRKLIDAKADKASAKAKESHEHLKEDLRREFTKPIAEVGTDAMQALDGLAAHEKRIVEVEVRTQLFWKMVERGTADMLRQPEE